MPAPAALFNRPATRMRWHAPKLAGAGLGAMGYLVTQHATWPGPGAYAITVLLMLAVWWWRGRDGLTGFGVAVQVMQGLLFALVGWLFAASLHAVLQSGG